MKLFTTKTLGVVIAAIVVVGAGAWYSRSSAPGTIDVNVSTTKILERKCSPQTLAEQVAAADLILTGEVFVVLSDEPDALVYIKPLTTYKGKVPTPLIIRAEEAGTTGEDTAGAQEVVVLPDGTKENELHFASGQAPYLLFLRASDNKFLTSRCDGSRVLGSGLTAEEQKTLTEEG